MSTYYVCATYDEYDPKTGYFVVKIDCIQWDENLSGVWNGSKYSSKEECYNATICSQVQASRAESNNYCNIFINNISVINLIDNKLTFEIQLPEIYDNTYIEYASYDAELNLLSDFQRVPNTPISLSFSNTFTIDLETEFACAIAFRLVKPCDVGSEGGSESGSEESGSEESGSEESGIAWQLFDLSSWANIASSMPMKDYLDQAAENWNNILKYNDNVFQMLSEYYQLSYPELNWNGLHLVNYVELNDPEAGFIAACGPIDNIDIYDNDPQNIKVNAATFQLWVNTYYNGPEWGFTDSDWINVLTHELGHALGIGVFWNLYNNFWLDGSVYNKSSLSYNTIIGDITNNRTLVPLEDSGGPGTQSAHWENNDRSSSYPNSGGYNYPNCNFDLMIGFFTVGNPRPISNLSKDFLIDIGYESTGIDVSMLPLLQPQITINSNGTNGISINNMCGTSTKCGCDTHKKIGVIDLVNNTFTAQQGN
jgi:hypothetical protein